MPTSFSADPSTLRELILQAGQGFYVPVYQRDFTWGEAEIDRLFEDVDHGITRASSGQSPSTFLGSVILVSDRDSVMPKNVDALPPTVLHVVDGQQRLTTLLLTFSILARFISDEMIFLQAEITAGSTSTLDTWLLNTLGERREDLLESIASTSFAGTDEFKMKPRLIRQASDVWGNDGTLARYESDVAWYLMATTTNRHNGNPHLAVAVPAARPHLERVARLVTDHVADIAQGKSDCEILNGLEFLSNTGMANTLIASASDPVAQPELLDDHRKAAARLLALASFLLNGVLVIDVKAPDEDYAFALFEPLNTTGQLLTALETLKPLIVQSEGGIANYSTSASAASFAKVEAHFPPTMKADERAKSSADLLTTFALAETGRRLARTLLDQRQYLRSEFQALAPPNGAITSSRAFVSHMAETSAFYFDIWSDPHSAFMAGATELDRLCLEVLRSTNHSIVIAPLTRYYEDWSKSPSQQRKAEFLAVLQAVTAFWTLWRTSRATTKGIDDIYRRLMSAGHTNTTLPALAWRPQTPAPLPAAAQLKVALVDILSTRGNITSKADWIAKASVQPLYQTSKQLAKFVLLAAHEDRIADQNGLIKRGVPGSFASMTRAVWLAHYSVEHIAPQTLATGDTSYAQAIYDQGLIDRLGNLTLMPVDLNTLVGNKTWPYKRDV